MTTDNELFIGRLGKNPDLRYTQKREPICFLSVAAKTADPNNPLWKRVIVWGKQAELASLYLKKGSEIFVQGQNQIREYRDKNKQMKEIEEVKARLIGFSNL